MQLRVSVPVANLLVYEPFVFAGINFAPSFQKPTDESFPDESNADSFLSSGNLSTAITNLSGVQLSDFSTVAVATFNINVDLTEYPRPNRADDGRSRLSCRNGNGLDSCRLLSAGHSTIFTDDGGLLPAREPSRSFRS